MKIKPNKVIISLAIAALFMSIAFVVIYFKIFSGSQKTSLKHISLNTWDAFISPHSLKIYGKKNGLQILMGQARAGDFENPLQVKTNSKSVEIAYPHLTVTIQAKDDNLHVYFHAKSSGDIAWPQTGTDLHMQALIYPDGEGLYIPLDDSEWLKQLNGTACNALSMPFYGYGLSTGETISYIMHSDLRNELVFSTEKNRLTTIAVHNCGALDQQYDYEMSMTFTSHSPLAPAFHYKNYLIKQGSYKSLSEKIQENPQVKKLFGAFHAYVWGAGRTVEFLEYIHQLGIDRLWIGYETELNKPDREMVHEVNNFFIHQAKQLGYLVGPYDSFHTMMDPKKADCPNVIFEQMYPWAAIVNQNGKRSTGFAGRGYHISSQALALNNNKVIYDRIEKFIKTGINSYFLDCDATGELFDDYATDHTMNQDTDRKNRLARMSYLANNKKMVLGSESAVAWAVPVLAFNHGTFAVNNSIHWKTLRNVAYYGGWYPKERKKIFFKNISASDEYIHSKYDPHYRLPLFQAVFHEAIITTDRWEVSHMKFTNLVKTRELLELLYGIPSIWALDLIDVKKYSAQLKKLFDFFSPLHKAIAMEPITSFAWLTADRMVQQITFGNVVELTANFSQHEYQGIPSLTIQAYWVESKKRELYKS